MIFRPELAAKVLSGEKTVTRRLVSDNPRSPWWRERCAVKVGRDYAVQPGRGKVAVARVRVRSVARELLAAVYWPRGANPGLACAEREAGREGFETFQAFCEAWTAINGRWDPLDLVWRVGFELVT